MDDRRFIFNIDAVALSFPLLEYYYPIIFLRPLLVMISDMVISTIKSILIMSGFLIGFAKASETLMNSEPQINGLGTFDLFRKLILNILGDLFLGHLKAPDQNSRCTHDPNIFYDYTDMRYPSEFGKYFGSALMGLYHLTTNIFLSDLLTASFNCKISDIKNKFENIRRYPYIVISIELSKIYGMPPPFFELTSLMISEYALGYSGYLYYKIYLRL